MEYAIFENKTELKLKLKNCVMLDESEPTAQAVNAKEVKATANGSLCSGALTSESIAAKITRL